MRERSCALPSCLLVLVAGLPGQANQSLPHQLILLMVALQGGALVVVHVAQQGACVTVHGSSGVHGCAAA